MTTGTHSQVSPKTVWTVGLHALALLILWNALQRLQPVLALLAIAGLVALALDPALRWLQRHGVARGWGVLLASLGLAGLLWLVGITIVPMLAQQVLSLVNALPELVSRLQDWGPVRWVNARFDVTGALEQQVGRLSASVAGLLVHAVTSAVELLFTGVTVFILTLFMLLSGGALYDQLLDWVRPRRRARVDRLLRRMRRAVGDYLAGSAVIVTIGGMVTATVSFALGVPYFLPLGLSYMMLGFIPYAGSFLVAVLVSLTTLATVGLQRALIALAIFLVYQQVEGNLLQPLVMRHVIRMNPLLISVVLLIGAATMGVLGAIIALPVAAALQVLLEDLHRRRKEAWARAHAAEVAGHPPHRPGRPHARGADHGRGPGAGGTGTPTPGGTA